MLLLFSSFAGHKWKSRSSSLDRCSFPSERRPELERQWRFAEENGLDLATGAARGSVVGTAQPLGTSAGDERKRVFAVRPGQGVVAVSQPHIALKEFKDPVPPFPAALDAA